MPKKQQANNGGGKNRKIGRNEKKYGKWAGPERFDKSREKRHAGPLGWYRAEKQCDIEIGRARKEFMQAERYVEAVTRQNLVTAIEYAQSLLETKREALEEAIAKKAYCHRQRVHMNRNEMFYLRELLPWSWNMRMPKVKIRRVRAIWGWVPLEVED